MATKAGIIIKTKFTQPNSQVFTNYIDYIDRDEAVKKEYEGSYSLFADYMDNSLKSEGLFNGTGYLSSDEKKSLKTQILDAQAKGSCLIQGLFSFDSEWIVENGLVDSETGVLREDTLREFACDAIQKMLEKEKFENAIWSASIHHNTEHVHVHFALVDPDVVWEEGKGRCFRDKNGILRQRGTISKKALDAGRSRLANSILNTKDLNIAVTNLIRDKIIGGTKSSFKEVVFSNKIIANEFLELVSMLPDDISRWGYGNSEMKPYREYIDRLTDLILEEELPDEFEELKDSLFNLQKIYTETYGKSYADKYYQNKMDDLYKRFGNMILSEAKSVYIKQRAEQKQFLKNNLKDFSPSVVKEINYALYQLKKAFKKDLSTIKNQAIYDAKFSSVKR